MIAPLTTRQAWTRYDLAMIERNACAASRVLGLAAPSAIGVGRIVDERDMRRRPKYQAIGRVLPIPTAAIT